MKFINRNLLQTVFVRNLLTQNDWQEFVVCDVLNFGHDGPPRFQKQCGVAPGRIFVSQNGGDAIVFLQEYRMQCTDGSALRASWAGTNINFTQAIRSQRLEIFLGGTIQSGTVDESGCGIHLITIFEIAFARLRRWHWTFVLTAFLASAHIALIHFVAGRATLVCLVATTSKVRRQRCNFDQIVWQQLTPCW